MNKVGWAAYARQGLLFVKRIPVQSDGRVHRPWLEHRGLYREHACFEVESLGPLVTLKPGQTAMHKERWFLFAGVTIPKDDAALRKRWRRSSRRRRPDARPGSWSQT